MSSPRPSYTNIVLEYLAEGFRAWQAQTIASAVAVESRLGLSFTEGRDFVEELTRLGMVREEEAINAVGAYRLAPRGLAFVERLPSLDQVLSAHASAVERVQGPPSEDKARATFSVRDTLIRQGLEKGIDVVLDNLPRLWRLLRAQFPWLPEIGT